MNLPSNPSLRNGVVYEIPFGRLERGFGSLQTGTLPEYKSRVGGRAKMRAKMRQGANEVPAVPL